MKDIAGQRFGRLVALERTWIRSEERSAWACQCDCGKTTSVRLCHLTSGKTRSCGCLIDHAAAGRAQAASRKPLNRPAKDRHNALYRTWQNMMHRCLDPRAVNFAKYGGRGISVCQRWRTYENFALDMGERPPGKTLDRIDNDRGYEPGNCRWATVSEQNANRRPYSWSRWRKMGSLGISYYDP